MSKELQQAEKDKEKEKNREKDNKKGIAHRVFLVLAILWMGTIFCFSAQPADESAETSHAVGMFLANLFVPGFEEWTDEEQEALAEKIDFPVRKGAHATEYCILGILVSGVLTTAKKEIPSAKRMILAVLVSALYASSDEFHQLFVDGRAGRVTDVLIDTSGATVGVFLLDLVVKIRNRKRKVTLEALK